MQHFQEVTKRLVCVTFIKFYNRTEILVFVLNFKSSVIEVLLKITFILLKCDQERIKRERERKLTILCNFYQILQQN